MLHSMQAIVSQFNSHATVLQPSNSGGPFLGPSLPPPSTAGEPDEGEVPWKTVMGSIIDAQAVLKRRGYSKLLWTIVAVHTTAWASTPTVVTSRLSGKPTRSQHYQFVVRLH